MAAGDGDGDRVGALAHLLGGAAAQVGATRLAALCRQLETTSAGGSAGEAPATLDAIGTECLGLPSALRRACPDLP